MDAHRPSPQSTSGHLWEESGYVDVADVVVDVDAPDLQPTYSYRVPEALRGRLQTGACVCIPFGRQEQTGYVMALRRLPTSDPLCSRLRDVVDIVRGAMTFDEEQAAIAQWISGRYVCDLSAAVRCIAPSAMSPKVVTRVRLASSDLRGSDFERSLPQAHLVETLRLQGGETDLDTFRSAAGISAFESAYSALRRKGLVEAWREVVRATSSAKTVRAYAPAAGADAEAAPSAAGKRILAALAGFARKGEVPVLPERLLAEAQASESALKTLVGQGLVALVPLSVRRSPLSIPAERTAPPQLTAGQHAAARYLAMAISSMRPPQGQTPSRSAGRPAPPTTALLFGVTASGKTEVYLDAIARTLQAGRTAIVLVPEIALTTQVVEVFTGRFGDEVALLHSRLSDGERHDEWRRLQEGRARIAVGARSAIFAPLRDLGLIVVDEEHEASYKQESVPRYNARDVAMERARLAGAAVVLGSATPSVETYHAAEQGRLARLEMPERVESRALPVVQVVDMREEFKEHRALFSRPLLAEMGDRLAKAQQAILFLNRRGYSQFILCRDCGFVARCPNCAVSLTLHAAWASLRCHHCDYAMPAPAACPSCGGTRIRGFGVGTEKVEEEVLRHFPSARVIRLDRDTTSRKGAHAGILRQFRHREADILIGTQMVAKGLDFPGVTLVGVVSADTSINMPDFRAAERTFQLLTQVAGRAGRGEHPGAVVIQTFSPDHYSVQHAMRQDYPGFYRREIAFREELRYPPFSRFVNLVCEDADAAAARDLSGNLAASLKPELPEGVEMLGPAPAPLAKLKGEYRRHVVLRGTAEDPLEQVVRRALDRLPAAERARIVVDVDPMSMV